MKYVLALFILIGSQPVFAGDALWSDLERQCETDFPAYEKSLERLHKLFVLDISRMSQKQYSALDQSSDPRLIFLALSWPSDLSDKDQFWKANQDCANVHWEARKTLRSLASTVTEKTERVTDLKNCVLTRFDRFKLVAPFNRIISCYEKRAAKK